MATLTVGYIADRRQACLSFDEHGTAWNDIKQACHDRAAEVEELGPLSISLPWWAFLNARAAVSFYVGRYALEVKFDAEARSLLQRSKSRANEYNRAVAAEPASEEDIRRRLREAGFVRPLKDKQLRNVRKLVAMDS